MRISDWSSDVCSSDLNEGLKSVTAGIDPMDIKRGIDKAVEAVTQEIKKNAVPCKDRKAIAQVGTVSANADEAIGAIIADAMDKVGKERSEEHTSELQSLMRISYAVFCLKKKTTSLQHSKHKQLT